MGPKQTVRLIVAFPAGSAACMIASYLVARILLMVNNGFGAGDMTAFLYWTVLFALALGGVPIAVFALLMRNARTKNRILVGVLLGGAVGFTWTLLNRSLVGPWFDAWSFNVLYCWTAGGALGILAAALLGRK